MEKTEVKEMVDALKTQINDVIEERLKTVVKAEVVDATRQTIDAMHLEKAVYGYDRTMLSDDRKAYFAKAVRQMVYGQKSNEELVEEVDSRGGVLVPTDVAASIVRVARTVGLAASQIMDWGSIKGDSVTIPAYTGSVLEGEFIDYHTAGSLTAVGFDHANLFVKKWQIAFALGNDLLEDASVQLGEWLIALAAESLANMIDKQVFAGIGHPFTGLLNDSNVASVTLPAGEDTFQEYAVIDDSSTVIGTLEESLLDGAAFFFSKTVWANLRTQKDDAGQYLLGNGAGNNAPGVMTNDPKSVSGPRPVGSILGFPVYTCRHLPALSASAASTTMGLFGNLKAAVAFSAKGDMRVEKYTSGTFGGKEIALADQQALVMKRRWGITTCLPEAVVKIVTHS